MARKALKEINWTAMAEMVPEWEKANYINFKAISDTYLRKMANKPENLPKIDWDFYKKNVTVSGLVDKFRKDYESLAIPYPEDKYSHMIEAIKMKYAELAIDQIKQSEIRIKTAEEGIEKIKNMVPVIEMTMEDFIEYYPECSPCNPDKPTFWPHDPEDQFHLIPGEYERLRKEEEKDDDH